MSQKFRLPALVIATLVAGFFTGARLMRAQGRPQVIVIQDVIHVLSPKLGATVPIPPQPGLRHSVALQNLPLVTPQQALVDSALQDTPGHAANSSPTQDSPGVGVGLGSYTDCCAPPDTNGAVGPTQFVQWVNSDFAVFSKSNGSVMYGPAAGNSLWQTLGGACASNNSGDPIAQFDKMAGRWVMMQPVFTSPYYLCVAVSTTSDATGSYNLYQFAIPNNYLPDYPKLGVWPDGYYVSYNAFQGNTFKGASACALDRSNMLNGNAATMQCFATTYAGLLPSDLDGASGAPGATLVPPAGSPNFYLNFTTNALNMWKFHVDWSTPGNSTFTGPVQVQNVAPFSPACNGGTCIPQSGTSQKLDSLGDRLMYRLAYRNFGAYQSLVVNHSVATSTGNTGVRWYEIRSPAAGPTVNQQGTFAPDSNYRWMGSIAMDQAGDMALGYSVSSSGMHPAIRYTGRVPSDPAGTMEAETTIIQGGGSQTRTLNRWGDYSSMAVDPTDDCTFWYTNEYLKSNGTFNWSTAIASFKFPSCTVTSPVITTQPANQTVTAGQTATFSVVATGTAPLSYVWSKNTIPIPGATSSSYTTPLTTNSDNGAQFAVVVSNSSGNTPSNIATLTVNPAATTVASVAVNPTSVVGGAANATGTVTLDGAAPTGGISVALSSSITAAATVPSSVLVLAGATSATFTVTTHAVSGQAIPVISAVWIGTVTTSLIVNPPGVTSLTLNPTVVTGGVANSTGTVVLNGPAPTSGISVGLSSSNPSAATVLSSVSVLGGATSATFPVTSQTVTGQTSTMITATLNGSANATLTVNPIPVGGSASFVRVAGGSKDSAAYTVAISPTAGDFLGVFIWSATTPTVTDNLGSTYTRDCTITYVQGSGTRQLTVFHLLNAPSGITGVTSSSQPWSRTIVAEYSGMPTGGAVLDVCGTPNTQNTVTSWSSTATTTTANDLVFGLADTGATAAAGYKASGAWTGRLEQPDPVDVDDSYLEDQINVAAGSYTATGTTTASIYEASVVVAFKTITGPVAPAITSANNTTFTVGTLGSFTVTTTGSPVPSLTESGSLPGVTFTDNHNGTATLSGTPGAGTAGSYPITITASNGVGTNATQSFTLTVNQAPAITSANNTTFTVGTAGSFTVTATGSPTPTLSETGALPSGVSFTAATGTLAGTPTAGGTFSITFTAHNGVSADATQSFTLTVNQSAAITSANNTVFTVGTAGSFTVIATGFPVPTLSESGPLPSGVTFTPATGKLTGTPAAGTAGSYPITFTAHNGIGADATQSFTLTVNEAVAGSVAFMRAAGNSKDSVAYTVAISPTAGDFLGVFVWSATTPTVSDNLGSAYTRDCTITYVQGSGTRQVTVFHLLNAPSGITEVTSSSQPWSRTIVAEYSGMPTGGAVLDVCGTPRTQTASTSWSSTATTTTANDLVFGLADTGATATAAYKASGAWTGRLEQPDPVDVDDSYLEDQVNVAAGSYTATGTTTPSIYEASVVVAFKTGH